ncbi:FxDxF family PEP-CTERM protein [Phenylobacterium sp.]|uniref:FxDxF family PEP-CTERM protein n=1 Tax=Phenylobacterium sp. TaxID=1871053 RepID=UPI00260137CC|nr:FxDxF family PEP-CTERM protein [Phenylobacterium sp.]
MKRLAFSIAASIAAVALTASAADAATYINYGPVGSDGGFSITFGNTGITDPAINDVFDFQMPSGRADFVVTSTMSGGSQNITWSSIAFNGTEFDSGSVGWNEFSFLNGVTVTKDQLQRLVLTGVGGGNASYSGVITFMPTAAVPEPASWALLIVGFGGAGAILRRTSRSRTVLPAAA